MYIGDLHCSKTLCMRAAYNGHSLASMNGFNMYRNRTDIYTIERQNIKRNFVSAVL